MALSDTPSKLESVWIQRNTENQYYEQLNVSGSNLIVYHSSSGELQADKITDFLSKYGTSGYFDGERPITRTPYVGLNMETTTVVDFLDKFFFPLITATIAITVPASTIYYETGSSQNQLVRTFITANGETLFESGSVKRDGLDWNTIAAPATPGVNINFTDTDISSSHIYQSFVSASNGVVASTARSVNFIYPYLWGMSTTAGLSGTALYSALTKTIEIQGNKSDSFVGVSTYIYFCFPASYPDLNSIKDPSNFEVITSFQYSSSVSVTSVGLTSNWTANYKVYRLILQADPNGTFTFYHS